MDANTALVIDPLARLRELAPYALGAVLLVVAVVVVVLTLRARAEEGSWE